MHELIDCACISAFAWLGDRVCHGNRRGCSAARSIPSAWWKSPMGAHLSMPERQEARTPSLAKTGHVAVLWVSPDVIFILMNHLPAGSAGRNHSTHLLLSTGSPSCCQRKETVMRSQVNKARSQQVFGFLAARAYLLVYIFLWSCLPKLW